MAFGALQNVNIPKDTGCAELVLILQIATVAPLQDQHGQGVFTLFHLVRDVKFGGGVRHLVIAQVLAVQPCVQAGVSTFEIQIGSGGVLVGSVVEFGDIASAGVFVGYIRGICRERITNVRVLVLIVTVVLPDAGHRNGVEIIGVEAQRVERLSQIVDIGIVLEFPIGV